MDVAAGVDVHGAAGMAVPTLISTLAISCVFVSVVFLNSSAKYPFTPLALVFAMLASCLLSRTLLTPITTLRDGGASAAVREP